MDPTTLVAVAAATVASLLGSLIVSVAGWMEARRGERHAVERAILAERLMAQLPPGAVAGRFGGDEFVLVSPCVAVHRCSLVPDERSDSLPPAVSDAMEDWVALTVTEHIRHAFWRQGVIDFIQQATEVVFEDGQVADALARFATHRVVRRWQEVGRVSHHAVHASDCRQDFAAVSIPELHFGVLIEWRRTSRCTQRMPALRLGLFGSHHGGHPWVILSLASFSVADAHLPTPAPAARPAKNSRMELSANSRI